ncbi:MAG: hypothetical protein JXQ76_11645 [Campylobacterales bacterium]|nr:hypothetical protein [Campylobacterales bacterium]
MANIIKGNQDGENGSNDTYRIPGRGSDIPRKNLVKEIEQGKHPNHMIIEINNKKYIKAKPNKSKTDNVNA